MRRKPPPQYKTVNLPPDDFRALELRAAHLRVTPGVLARMILRDAFDGKFSARACADITLQDRARMLERIGR